MPIDVVNGHLKGRIRRQCRGIDHERIRSRGQGRDSPGAIACVAFLHVLQERANIYSSPSAEQLPVPPVGAGFQAGGNEKFDGRLGADHGADIAAVEDRAGRTGPLDPAGGSAAKPRWNPSSARADAGDRRHPRRGLGGNLVAQRRIGLNRLIADALAAFSAASGSSGDCSAASRAAPTPR